MIDDPPQTPDNSIVDLASHAEAADEHAAENIRKTCKAASKAVFLTQMNDRIEQIRAPWPPMPARVAGALTLSLRDLANIPLPTRYREATAALRDCDRVDECRDWANRAEALAVYARQAGDGSLLAMACRIRLRATRRCGELLQEIEAAKPGRKLISVPPPAPNSEGRFKAGQTAGLSRRQTITALRLASIPGNEFEKAVERKTPPTVTALAERGRGAMVSEAHIVDVTFVRDDDATLAERATARQVAILMAVWAKTEPKARLRFLENIGASSRMRSPTTL